MGLRSRVKGAAFEREIANWFRLVLGVDAQRGLSQTRDGGEVPDVEGVPLCWIETKIGRATNPIKALEQAITAQATRGDERMPVAICKNNRGRTTVTLQVEDFAWLLEGKLREGEGA